MKKTVKRFFVVGLASLMLFSAFGCQKKTNEDEPPVEEVKTETLKYTDEFLAKRESETSQVITTDYDVLISETASAKERYAAEEIAKYLKEATTATFDIITDANYSYTSNSTIISVGLNKVSEALEVIPSYEEVGKEGFAMQTKDKSIFISGYTDADSCTGTLNGAFKFLEKQIEWDLIGCEDIIYTKYKELKLIDVNYTDRPDIENHMGTSGAFGSTYFAERMGMVAGWQDVYNNQNTPYHNTVSYYLPLDKYGEAHPDWYSPKQNQLCYTCHGNEEEYNALVEEVFNIMVAWLPEGNTEASFTFTNEDNYDACNCSSCQEATKTYKQISGTMVNFMNSLSDRFARHFEENNIDRPPVKLFFFAYNAYEGAPAEIDDEGNITTYITARDNVFPIYCSIAAERHVALTHPDNSITYKNMMAWRKICKGMAVWTYSANFINYLAPADLFEPMQENYRFFKELNVISFFDQAQSGQAYYATGFNNLAYWLKAKLHWDVDADVEELTAKFFKYHYSTAGDSMYEYYQAFRMHLAYLQTLDYGMINFPAANAQYFPYGLLLQWRSMIDKAYDDIEDLKQTDSKRYEAVRSRISAEKVCVEYLLLQIYGGYLSTEEKAKAIQDFYALAKEGRVTMALEHGVLNGMFG